MCVKRKKTIRKRLIISVVVILILQTALYAMVFLNGNILTHINNNALDILNGHTINQKLYLQNEMLHRWSNLKETESRILAKTSDVLSENGAALGDIKEDAALNEKIIDRVAPEIVYLLRKNAVTGAFVVLDGAGIQNDKTLSTRAGFYVRSSNPSNYSISNSDLLLERGPSSVSYKMNISLGFDWNNTFVFSGKNAMNERFFVEPLMAAKNGNSSEKFSNVPRSIYNEIVKNGNDNISANYGYWSDSFSFSGKGEKVITYSIPLMDKMGNVFGVLGVDINESYITSMLNYEEINSNNQGVYVLGIMNYERTKIYPSVNSGPCYKEYFGDASHIKIGKKQYENIFKLQSKNNSDKVLYASVQPLELYNSGTPFENQKWALMSIVQQKDLFAFPKQMKMEFFLATIISFLLGILGIVIVSNLATKPLIALVKDLKQSDPNKVIALRKTNIYEFDELSSAIENLSSAVADSSSTFSEIIQMTDVPMGVFIYQKGNPTAFCSSNVFSLLDWPYDPKQKNCVDSEMITKRLDELKRISSSDGERLFLYERSDGDRWLRINYIIEKERYMGTIFDVTEELKEKQKIEHERDYDPLTNLFNRQAFMSHMEKLFHEPRALKIAALVMWDLDNLKYVNDTYGHDCGDKYIEAYAQTLKAFRTNHNIIARRSGDEFYAFLYGYDSKDDIRNLISEVYASIRETTFDLPNGSHYRIHVSGGIAWYPDDSTNYKDLIRYADFAMYSIKHKEKGNIQEFEKEMYLENSILINGQEALDRLIYHHLVKFAMQPILQVDTGTVYGYEMLMRSLIPEFRSPLDIMRMARSQSKLYEIEKLTMFKAVEAFENLCKNGKICGNEKMFVNSIASQKMSVEDEKVFHEHFGKSFLERLVLEITESDPCDQEFTRMKKESMTEHHGLIAIDDYGSGYNSESLLIFLSPDIVKVDISIVHGIDKDLNRQSVFDNLISYAKKRGIKVLAEGVETREEMEVVIAHGADYLQGYYVGKPAFGVVPIDDNVIETVRLAYKTYADRVKNI